jgi:hypothetical protein
MLSDEVFIDIRLDVLREFKRMIEAYATSQPTEYKQLKEFCEMSQQHP